MLTRRTSKLVADLSIHVCVGVVSAPSRGMVQGQATWSCKLLLSQIGKSAAQLDGASIVCQEVFNLRCRGAAITAYCVDNLKDGSVVHAVSKLIMRPKFVPIHGTYVEETDLLITDNFGLLRKISSL